MGLEKDRKVLGETVLNQDLAYFGLFEELQIKFIKLFKLRHFIKNVGHSFRPEFGRRSLFYEPKLT